MRYFFALRYRLFGKFNQGKRFVSYKTRLNLISVLNNTMSNSEAREYMLSVSAAAKKNQNCTLYAVDVLSNGACGSKSVCVQTDLECYLFNCGEGTVRLATEYKLKLAKTKTIFVTYHSWSSVGGIMSLCLTLQSKGVTHIFIYGPPNIKEIILGMRLFVYIKNVSLIFITDQPKFKYDDSLLEVEFVPIYPDKSSNSNTSEPESPGKQDDGSDSDYEEPSPKRICQLELKTGTNASKKYALCYICTSREMGAHVDVEKCNKLGVPHGPLIAQLKMKNNVTLPNGKVVLWQDVLKSHGDKEIFLLVDCPGEEFLDSFVNQPEFSRFHGFPEKPAAVVIHFTEPEIMNNPKYLEWMSRFPSSTSHIKVNSSNRVLDHVHCYDFQEKLHLIDPEIFPKLKEDNIPEVKEELSGQYSPNLRIQAQFDGGKQLHISKEFLPKCTLIGSDQFLKSEFNEIEDMNGVNVISSYSTLRWLLSPKMEYKFSHSLYIDRNNCLNKIFDMDNIQEQLQELRKLKMSWMASDECNALPDYPKIIFLGTGSSVPCTIRNTSAILVEYEEGQYLLLDCGEGTYGQMLRFFGKENIEYIMKNLRLIFVSHQHGDHHLGLIKLLNARYKILTACKREDYMDDEFKNHLVMFLPPSVRDWIHINNKCSPIIYDARIIVTTIAKQEKQQDNNAIKKYTNNLGITHFKTASVHHTHDSCGVTFTTPNDYQITYSGDCTPSDNLVELGKQCDLLIHEATFEDGMESMARHKKHSTVGQALNIGKRMDAKFTMLTHFSQRYSHLPQLFSDLPENSGITFDNMIVTPKTMPFLKTLMKFYKMIFATEVVSMNSKSVKRLLREDLAKEAVQMKI